MSIQIIDKLQPLGKFPVADAKDIDVNGTRLDNALLSKADISSVNAKADKSYVNASLSGKVDKIDGKGLSENDYSDEERIKVANAQATSTAFNTMFEQDSPNINVKEEMISDRTKNPVTSTKYINHGNEWLNYTIEQMKSDTEEKADKFYVNSELSKKANVEALSGKADASVVAQLQSTVNLKANASAVSELSSRVNEVEDDQSALSARMDEFSRLPDGSTSGDAELIDIRAGANGKTYSNAGNAVRGQVSELKIENETIKTELRNQSQRISNYSGTTSEVKAVVDKITELLPTTITNENGVPINVDASNELNALTKCIKTDSALSSEVLPANAKAVRDFVEKEIEASEKRNEINYDYFGLNVLRLYGSLDGISKNNKVNLKYNFNGKKGSNTLKLQGSTSLGYPKKNFTIVFDSPITVKPTWGEQTKFCLKANWVDSSQILNIMCAEIWGDIVRTWEYEREDIEIEEGVPLTDEEGNTFSNSKNPFFYLANGGAIDGEPCIILINDEYHGLYTINIPKDGWMFNMDAMAQHHTKVALFELEAFTDNIVLNNTEHKIEVEYCNTEDESWIKSNLDDLIAEMKACDSREKYLALLNKVDINSFTDYICYIMLTGLVDNIYNNILWVYLDDKLYISPYDLEMSFGNMVGHNNPTARPTFMVDMTANRMFNLIVKYDKENLKKRYDELRSGIFNDSNVWQKLYKYSAKIPKSLYNIDSARWQTMPETESHNIANFYNYYKIRSAFADEKSTTELT